VAEWLRRGLQILNESRSTHVGHKELFDWFKIDQVEFDKKFMKLSELED